MFAILIFPLFATDRSTTGIAFPAKAGRDVCAAVVENLFPLAKFARHPLR
jgi:hypothetical protein